MHVLAVEWSQGVEDAWSDVASFVPKLLGFLIILAIGYFVVKAIAKIADSVLERVGFDRAVERGGVKQALSTSKYDASDIVSKIVFWTLFLFVLQLAFGVFGDNPMSELVTSVIAYLPKVFVAIVIVVIASALAAGAREIIDASLGGLGYGKTLANVAGIAIMAVGAFAALNQLEIAPEIVTGLFYAILAVIAGSAIIAIGGGGIQPMRTRWEQALQRYDEEKPKMQREMDGARDRIEARAKERAEQVSGRGEAEVTTTAEVPTAGATSTTVGADTTRSFRTSQ
jgi:hypothetical protein